MRYSSKSGTSTPFGTPIFNLSHKLHNSKLTADAKTTTWAQSESNKKMSIDSDNYSGEVVLGDSAYEFINTDEESRDDNTTESVASTDIGRHDDLISFESTESSDEDSNERNNLGLWQSAFPYEIVPQNSLSSKTNQDSDLNADKIVQPISSSLEFEECFDEDEVKICVRRTVAELDEEQTQDVLRLIPKHNPAKNVLLSVRQTMTKFSLSIKQPLRILYVGSHLARQDIIHKIASSVIASAENITRDKEGSYSGSQHYNVIPISAFGSENAPEIELMHSSRYQIKVDNCYSAYNLKSENDPNSPDVIKLILDDDFTCHSLPSDTNCYSIEPSWELPHIAIIYCSTGDDINIKRTRAIVRKFLSRHGIPSILISQVLLLNNSPLPPLDQHSIHMCLESKDPKEGRAIVHQRFPINLDTFLNLDARQINKNLAYLTGLHEPICNPTSVEENISDYRPPKGNDQTLKEYPSAIWSGGSYIISSFCSRIILWGLSLAVLFAILNHMNISRPAISVNNKLILNPSRFQLASSLSIIPPKILAIYRIFKPSYQDETNICYMSFGPKIFAESVNKNVAAIRINPDEGLSSASLSCSAEAYGEKSILIRILGSSRFKWPKSETISIGIVRDNITIDADEAFGYEKCLVLLIPRNKAYGVINVSVNTENKLTLHETCSLDFGPSASQIMQILKNKMSNFMTHQIPTEGNYFACQHKRRTLNVIQNYFSKYRAKFLTSSDIWHYPNLQPTSFSNFFAKNYKYFSPKRIKKSIFSLCNDKIIQKKIADSHVALNVVKKFFANYRFVLINASDVHHKAKYNLHILGSSLIDTARKFSLQTTKKFAIFFKEVDIQAVGVKKAVRNFIAPQHRRLFAAQVKSNILWLKLRRRDKEAEQYQKKALAVMQRYSNRKSSG
ncbi:hypothetical protein HI914_06044 [Erysiphe necator]|nr:hypothetical protein HI914_06044 [Erysiphe necator]